MATTTALDIIKSSLKDAGVLGMGQDPNAIDVNDAFTRLNWMLSQWNRQRWLVYHLVDLGLASTGAQFYTIGPGGDYNLAVRPDRLEAAYFRQIVQSQPNQIDYPLQLLQSYEDYMLIALKQLQSFPNYCFYDSDWQVGKVYFWPIPQAVIYEVHVVIKETLTSFVNINDAVNLPDEYRAALHYNLAVRNCIAYPRPVEPGLVALAKESLNVVRGAQAQIARLQMPADLQRPGIYNPYSDQIR